VTPRFFEEDEAMSVLDKLVGFGLRLVIGEGVENVVEAVKQRFRDHGQALLKAIVRASDRTWQALEIALAGDGLLDRIKGHFASGDDKGVREQVRLYLQASVAQALTRCSAALPAARSKERRRVLPSMAIRFRPSPALRASTQRWKHS
jgi:hypothetical protein